MQSFLAFIKVCIVVCVFGAAVFITGCGENPQREADKQAKAAVEAAVNEYAATRDFNKAQKALKQALAGVSSEGASQETVLLVDGTLGYGKATEMHRELEPLWGSIEKNLDELAGIASQITQADLEKLQIDTALRSLQEERRQLTLQLEGEAGKPGLAAKQQDEQAKLADFKSQQSELEQKLSDKLKQATELQRQAEELLAKAELAKGTKKADLQKQAYDVLLGSGGTAGKNVYLTEAQELQDQLKTVESEMALVEPKVATLTAQIEKVRKRVDELDKSDFVAKSNERLTEIASTLAKFQEEFSGVLGQIEQTQSKLADKMKQMTDLLASAQKSFKKITTEESLREFGRVAGAEALLFEGRIRGEYAISQRHLAARLAILASGEATESQAQLKTLAQKYVDDSDEYVSKAIADYNDAANLYGKIPAKKEEFAIAVLRNRILVLAQKAYLAERVENMEAKAAAIAQAKDLIEKAVKYDPTFEVSLSQPPYSILGGKAAVEAPVEEEKAAPVKAETKAKPAAESNRPAAEPEPNQPAEEPNQPATVPEPNKPAEEPNTMPSEPNAGV